MRHEARMRRVPRSGACLALCDVRLRLSQANSADHRGILRDIRKVEETYIDGHGLVYRAPPDFIFGGLLFDEALV